MLRTIVKKAFLEANAIQRFLEFGFTGTEARAVLLTHGYEPVIGIHVIYELARTFIAEGKADIAKRLFVIIKELQPLVVEEPFVQLRKEILSLNNKKGFSPFLNGSRLRDTYAEINKLSLGIFDSNALEFITTRQNKFESDHQLICEINKSLDETPSTKLTRVFDGYLNYHKKSFSRVIELILNHSISVDEAVYVAGNIERLPVIRSCVRANYYLCFLLFSNPDNPKEDKVDDHRHVLEASYCDAFITEDKQLLKSTKSINPDMTALKWSSIFNIFKV